MWHELFWLIMTTAMTGLMWIPYTLDRIIVRGLMATMANPSPNDKPQSSWAQRLMAAHRNAVENLVIFAPLVLATQDLNVNLATPTTTFAMPALFLVAACACCGLYRRHSGAPYARLHRRFRRAAGAGAGFAQVGLSQAAPDSGLMTGRAFAHIPSDASLGNEIRLPSETRKGSLRRVTGASLCRHQGSDNNPPAQRPSGNRAREFIVDNHSFPSFAACSTKKSHLESPKMVHNKILEATHEYHWNYPRLEKWRSNRVDRR
jgi:hypothetical protein